MNETQHDSNKDGEVCEVIGFLPFSYLGTDWGNHELDPPKTGANWVYTHLAAALMAADHFNTRNPVVVAEVKSAPYMKNCTSKLFVRKFANTDSDHSEVAKFLMSEAYDEDRKSCAIVGPWYNTPSREAATFAAGMEVPMVTHGSDDITLTSVRVYPQVARTTVSLHAMAEVVISYFRYHGRTDFLATVGVSVLYGDQWRETLDNAAKEAGFHHHDTYVIAPPFEGYEPNRGVGFALKAIKESGYRNIFLVLNQVERQLPRVANFAEEHKLNQGEHVWLISGNVDFGSVAKLASQNANISKLVRGMGSIRPLDSFIYEGYESPFLKAWKANDETFVERVNTVHPVQVGSPGYFQAEADYFQGELPSSGAGFIYDAMMSIGLGKCLMEKRKASEHDEYGNTDQRRRKVRGTKRNGKARRQLRVGKKGEMSSTDHTMAIFDLDFSGASGQVVFGENGAYSPGSRQRETVTYGVYNFRAIPESYMKVNPNIGIWYHLTDLLQNSTTDLNWHQTENGPFVFNNGMSVPPLLNRDLPKQNYLSSSVRGTGLALMSIALFLVTVSTVVIFFNRREDPFRQAQPVFLYMLMFGAFVLSWSILPLSFDEGVGWTQSMLSSACLARPWLVALGYMTMYLALFSKLWRINRVLQLRRKQVLERHVVGPFVLGVLAAMIVLISWTVVDPLHWKRKTIDDTTGETYGSCTSDKPTALIIPLVFLMLLSTAACGFMAYKCKDIDSRFQESSWIFYTIFLQVHVSIVGIPVLIILRDASADATYLGECLLIFVIVMTTVLLMIGPKILALLGFVSNAPGETNGSQRSGFSRRDSNSFSAGSYVASDEDSNSVASSRYEGTNERQGTARGVDVYSSVAFSSAGTSFTAYESQVSSTDISAPEEKDLGVENSSADDDVSID